MTNENGKIIIRVKNAIARAGDAIRDVAIAVTTNGNEWSKKEREMYERTLFDQLPDLPASRASDSETSRIAEKRLKRSSKYERLMMRYAADFLDGAKGLSDSQVGRLAGINCAHKRCSELIRLGLIEKIGTTTGEFGTPVRVCTATPYGLGMWMDVSGGDDHE